MTPINGSPLARQGWTLAIGPLVKGLFWLSSLIAYRHGPTAIRSHCDLLNYQDVLVGVAGFEPAVSRTQTERFTRLSYTPIFVNITALFIAVKLVFVGAFNELHNGGHNRLSTAVRAQDNALDVPEQVICNVALLFSFVSPFERL